MFSRHKGKIGEYPEFYRSDISGFLRSKSVVIVSVISQILLAVPVILLYEVSILCAQFIEKQRGDMQPEEDDEGAGLV